jgi:hypothetical protein
MHHASATAAAPYPYNESSKQATQGSCLRVLLLLLLQGDLLRPLALPALLVGDHALGGISTTLSAYESLLLRGHTPAAVVMMADGRLNNVNAVAQHLQHAAVHRCVWLARCGNCSEGQQQLHNAWSAAHIPQ